MRGISDICDYFLICDGSSTRRVSAIADGISEELVKHDIAPFHVEGKREALWVLLDYRDVIAHIFYGTTRGFYNLERLWGDAPRKQVKEAEEVSE